MPWPKPNSYHLQQLVEHPRCLACGALLDGTGPCHCQAQVENPPADESLFPGLPTVKCIRCGCTKYDVLSDRFHLEQPDATCCGEERKQAA